VFDEAATRAHVRKRVTRSNRPVGQPVFTPVLDRLGFKITPDAMCDPLERDRRAQIAASRVRAVLHVGSQQVLASEPVSLSFPGFSLSLHTRCTLSLLAPPSSIKCSLYQVGLFGDTLLTELYLPVPLPSQAPAVERYVFSGRAITGKLKHLANEAGISIGRRVSGELEALVTWVLDEANDESAQVQQDDVTGDQLRQQQSLAAVARANRKAARIVSMQLPSSNGAGGTRVQASATMRVRDQNGHLGSILSKGADVDPNDPRNAPLLELLRRARLMEAKG